MSALKLAPDDRRGSLAVASGVQEATGPVGGCKGKVPPTGSVVAPALLRGQFGVSVDQPSWDDILDGAVRLYWKRRNEAADAEREAKRQRLLRDVHKVWKRVNRTGKATLDLEPCPSVAAYERHRKRGETCPQCSDYRRAYDHARRERGAA